MNYRMKTSHSTLIQEKNGLNALHLFKIKEWSVVLVGLSVRQVIYQTDFVFNLMVQQELNSHPKIFSNVIQLIKDVMGDTSMML